jgi:hypothetical protein
VENFVTSENVVVESTLFSSSKIPASVLILSLYVEEIIGAHEFIF